MKAIERHKKERKNTLEIQCEKNGHTKREYISEIQCKEMERQREKENILEIQHERDRKSKKKRREERKHFKYSVSYMVRQKEKLISEIHYRKFRNIKEKYWKSQKLNLKDMKQQRKNILEIQYERDSEHFGVSLRKK